MTRLARAAVATALVSASYLVGLAPSSNLHEAQPGAPSRFQNAAHWNEAGDLLAAVCLYHYLEQDANLPRLSENELREALYRHYAACRNREAGWTPGGRRATTVPASSAELAGARQQYSALDQAGEVFNYAAQRPGGGAPGTLVRAGADVRIDGDRIVYTKAPPCRTDPGEPFFLHVAPADANHLADDGSRAAGFDNIGFPDDFWRAEQNRCVGERGLPDYDIAYLRTGQFDPQTDATTWEANFVPEDGAAGGGPPRPDGVPGADDRAGADVRIDGDRIVYTKAPPCRTDPGEPFFLHVAPADANHLADDGSRAAGFDNIGFPDDFWRAEQNRCVGERGLPDYDIAYLRTGQFDPQTDATTWEANFVPEDGAAGGGPPPPGGDAPGALDQAGADAQIAAVNARFDELQGELRDLRTLVTDAIKGAAPPD